LLDTLIGNAVATMNNFFFVVGIILLGGFFCELAVILARALVRKMRVVLLGKDLALRVELSEGKRANAPLLATLRRPTWSGGWVTEQRPDGTLHTYRRGSDINAPLEVRSERPGRK
jgi:hypothetical protein